MGMSDYFIFDDIDTRNFQNILVFFQEVDSTPKRVYQTIGIPARNGEFYIDEGRYEDVDHSYDIIALTKQDGSDFINALASKVGYHRLEDAFNIGEFYRAVFTSGADVSMTTSRDQNTFRVTFTRKPQRWLTSGEVAVSVSSGGTLTNPTQYESEPLLAIEGYGTIGFNGYEIELENAVLGNVLIRNGASGRDMAGDSIGFGMSASTLNLLNEGDTLTFGSLELVWTHGTNTEASHSGNKVTSASLSSNSGVTGSTASCVLPSGAARPVTTITLPRLEFAKGTELSYSNTTVVSGTCFGGGGNYTAECVLTVSYNGSNRIFIQTAITYSYNKLTTYGKTLSYGDVTGYSTQSQLGNPTYIDCEMGSAYKVVDGDYVSLNGNVDLGSDLPTLAGGANEITYDNTITALSITPRWWKL